MTSPDKNVSPHTCTCGAWDEGETQHAEHCQLCQPREWDKLPNKLHAFCIVKGFSDEDADAFVDAMRVLGRAEVLGDGSLTDLLEAYRVMDKLIDKYPEIQR